MGKPMKQFGNMEPPIKALAQAGNRQFECDGLSRAAEASSGMHRYAAKVTAIGKRIAPPFKRAATLLASFSTSNIYN